MRPEEKIEKEVCKYARAKGIDTVKMSIPGRRSYPDRQFLVHSGYMFFIEFKSPGERPNAQQQIKLSELKSRGFAVFVIDNIEDGKTLVDRELKKLAAVKRSIWQD